MALQTQCTLNSAQMYTLVSRQSVPPPRRDILYYNNPQTSKQLHVWRLCLEVLGSDIELWKLYDYLQLVNNLRMFDLLVFFRGIFNCDGGRDFKTKDARNF